MDRTIGYLQHMGVCSEVHHKERYIPQAELEGESGGETGGEQGRGRSWGAGGPAGGGGAAPCEREQRLAEGCRRDSCNQVFRGPPPPATLNNCAACAAR